MASTSTDFTRYQPPGVYTQQEPGPQLGVASTIPTALGIFGKSVGYRTYKESLLINPDSGAITTIQTIHIPVGTTDGTFTATLSGQTTTGIDFDALDTAVQAAFEALSNLSPGDVLVSGTGGAGGTYTVTLNGDYPALTANGTGLTPSAPTLDVDHEQTGTPAINKTLTYRGIKLDSVKVWDPNSGQVWVEGTDYTVLRLSQGDDTTPGTRDDTYTIQRVIDGGHIEPGDIVTVEYNYTDPDYFNPYPFYDWDDIREYYGESYDSNGNLQSEITLMSKFAMDNGAYQIVCVAVDAQNPSAPTIGEYADALDKFRDEPLVGIIVPAIGAQPIHALVQQHVNIQSNNRYERRAIVARDGTGTVVSSSQRMTDAQSLHDERIMMVSPSTFKYFAPELGVETLVGGQYMAAALAGISIRQNPAEPLTRKRVFGFTDVGEILREGAKNQETQSGLCVVEKTRRQIMQVRHGVTTNFDDLLKREWSIIGQADAMVFRIRDYLENAGLIGRPILDTTLISVKASTVSSLESLVRDKIIRGYREVKVRQISTLPDVIEVKYEWRPSYPLNYIVVKYSVAVEDGSISTELSL